MAVKEKTKIGIPRALLYHKYYKLWENFFEGLNCQIVLSPQTNKKILERGANLAIDESCLSLKIFLGHVDYLKDKADYIFIPHIVSLHRGEEICVKLMAMYDIACNTFKNANFIEYTVDADKFLPEFIGFLKLGWSFSKNPFLIISAYLKAKKEQENLRQKLINEQEKKIASFKPGRPAILIVSHPYTIYDSFLGKPIIDFLDKEGVDVIYSDIADKDKIKNLSDNISSDLYWTYNKELLGGLELYKDKADGIIFLVTFPCGPDALVVNLCQNKIKKPMITIILDELQGEAGLRTRLESFVDILKIRKKKNGRKRN
ncbi:MAG: acyl-CoA dehydratase activase-related protein [Candidatus Staskawiczbacteria bacterium]|jgi:predicted nucleotide-binding protein (sugar kinase/HSP70/actin superfamily)